MVDWWPQRRYRYCPPPVATEWTVNPPELADLKQDLNIPDTRDDAVLQVELDAAIAYAMAVRPELNYDADVFNPRPAPSAAFRLGVIRQAGRWHARRRSPDATIAMGDLGTSRVPSFDPDIERMMGIGRYKGPTFA
jgi:hypothetical protein